MDQHEDQAAKSTDHGGNGRSTEALPGEMLCAEHSVEHSCKCLRPRLNLLSDLHPNQPNRNLELGLIRQNRLNPFKELPDDPGKRSTSDHLTGRRVDEGRDGRKIEHLGFGFGWLAGLGKRTTMKS